MVGTGHLLQDGGSSSSRHVPEKTWQHGRLQATALGSPLPSNQRGAGEHFRAGAVTERAQVNGARILGVRDDHRVSPDERFYGGLPTERSWIRHPERLSQAPAAERLLSATVAERVRGTAEVINVGDPRPWQRPEGPDFHDFKPNGMQRESTFEVADVSFATGVRGESQLGVDVTIVSEVPFISDSAATFPSDSAATLPSHASVFSCQRVKEAKVSTDGISETADPDDAKTQLEREFSAKTRLQDALSSLERESQTVHQVVSDARSLQQANNELKVELVCASRVRDTLQADLMDENAVASKLKEELGSEQASANSAQAALSRVQDFPRELRRVELRASEAQAELQRSLLVREHLQGDLAQEATTTARLRHQLAVTEAKCLHLSSLPRQEEPKQAQIPAECGSPGTSVSLPAFAGSPSACSPETIKNRIGELESVANEAIAKQQRLKIRLREEVACVTELRNLAGVAEKQAAATTALMFQKLATAEDQAQALQAQAARSAAAERFRGKGKTPSPQDGELARAEEKLESESFVVAELREKLAYAESQVESASSGHHRQNDILRSLAWEGAPVGGNASAQCALAKVSYRASLSDGDMCLLFDATAADDFEGMKSLLPDDGDAVFDIVRIRDTEGRNLLEVAVSNGSEKCMEFFLEEGSKLVEQQKFREELQSEMMEREIGLFVNGGFGRTGESCLHLYCARPDAHHRHAVALLEANANPVHRDNNGMTPFSVCAKAGHVNIMHILVKGTKGFVLKLVDDNLRSALHWAATEGQVEATELLLKVKADADAVDADVRTPADIARDKGHEQLVLLLAESMSDEVLSKFMSQIPEDANNEDIPVEARVRSPRAAAPNRSSGSGLNRDASFTSSGSGAASTNPGRRTSL